MAKKMYVLFVDTDVGRRYYRALGEGKHDYVSDPTEATKLPKVVAGVVVSVVKQSIINNNLDADCGMELVKYER